MSVAIAKVFGTALSGKSKHDQHFERALFQFAKPRMVLVTTPNIEFNQKFETLPCGISSGKRFLNFSSTPFEQMGIASSSWHLLICRRGKTTIVREEDIAYDAPVVSERTHLWLYQEIPGANTNARIRLAPPT